MQISPSVRPQYSSVSLATMLSTPASPLPASVCNSAMAPDGRSMRHSLTSPSPPPDSSTSSWSLARLVLLLLLLWWPVLPWPMLLAGTSSMQ